MAAMAQDKQSIEAAFERAARLRSLRGQERTVLVEFLLELGELERLRQYEAFGCASIWDFCREQLSLRDGSAGRRIGIARLIQRFPIAVEYLRDLRLGMTTLSTLEDVLTEQNVREVLDRASHRSAREVDVIAATMKAPQAEPAESIRKLPVAIVKVVPPALPPPKPEGGGLFAAAAAPAESPAAPAPQPQPEERYSINLRVGREFMNLLDRARIAASHVVPDGDIAAVLERGLREIVRQSEKKSRPPARVAKQTPRTAVTPSKKRKRIPAALERFVRQRDHDRCQWPKPDGGICGSTWRTEIDHIVPEAKGGPATAKNTRVLCDRHNDQHAREQFGEAFMASKQRAKGS
jgi:5-methylcytosine-specific restriction endonuclease McrA